MSSSLYGRGDSSTSIESRNIITESDNADMSSTTNGRTLRLAVFDLDFTVWQPEMYELIGNPYLVQAKGRKLTTVEKKEARTTTEGMILIDKSASPIRVFTGASYALSDILRLKSEGHDIQAAVASRTDEPEWAYTCMKHLAVPILDSKDGTSDSVVSLLECFGGSSDGKRKKNPLIQISFQDKKHHFQRLHKETGIPYEDMVFFDNEDWNIRSVSQLGVKCIYTPDGMQKRHWDEAKKAFGIEDL